MTFDLTEVTLTGNMELSEMQSRKIKWQTRDDALGKGVELDFKTDPSAIKLEPMRIRVFKVVAKPASEINFLQ